MFYDGIFGKSIIRRLSWKLLMRNLKNDCVEKFLLVCCSLLFSIIYNINFPLKILASHENLLLIPYYDIRSEMSTFFIFLNFLYNIKNPSLFQIFPLLFASSLTIHIQAKIFFNIKKTIFFFTYYLLRNNSAKEKNNNRLHITNVNISDLQKKK